MHVRSKSTETLLLLYSLAWFSAEVTVGGRTVDRSQAGPKGFFAFMAQIKASVISPKGSHTHTLTHSGSKRIELNWIDLNSDFS